MCIHTHNPISYHHTSGKHWTGKEGVSRGRYRVRGCIEDRGERFSSRWGESCGLIGRIDMKGYIILRILADTCT